MFKSLICLSILFSGSIALGHNEKELNSLRDELQSNAQELISQAIKGDNCDNEHVKKTISKIKEIWENIFSHRKVYKITGDTENSVNINGIFLSAHNSALLYSSKECLEALHFARMGK